MTNQTSGTSTNNPPTKSVLDLPLRGTKNAPKTFKGKFNRVKEFFYEVETTCGKSGITEKKDKCKAVVRYCSYEVVDVIEGLASYKTKDFDELKKEMIFIYDGDRTEVRYGVKDIYPLVKKWHKAKISDLATYKEYYKEFQKVVGWLHVRNKVSDEDFKLWFWAGLPKRFQGQVETRMRTEDPALDDTQPFGIQTITDAVTKMYTRDRFENRIPLLMERRKKRRDDSNSESSESESETESEKSEESDQDDNVKEIATRIKKLAKSKRRVRFEEEEPAKKEATVAKVDAPTDSAVDPLIEKMKSLSLSEKEYKALWVQVMREYVSEHPGKAQINTVHEPKRDPPPHMSRNEPRFNSGSNTFERETPRQCFGCGKMGHTLVRCERISKAASQGLIRKGPVGRWIWQDGSPIVPTESEFLCDAIDRRLKQTALVMTSRDAGNERSNTDDSDDESEMVKGDKTAYLSWYLTGEEDDDGDRARSLGTRHTRGNDWADSLPGIEDNGKAFVVERPERVSREARYRSNEKGYSQGAPQGKTFPARDRVKHTRNVLPGTVPKDIDRGFGRNRDDRRNVGIAGDKDVVDVNEDAQGSPMLVDEKPVEDREEKLADNSGRHGGNMIRERGNMRPGSNKAMLEVIKEVMNQRLTLPLCELLRLAPGLQRDLGKVLKGMPVADPREPDRSEGKEPKKESIEVINGKKILLQERSRPWGKPRDVLLKVEARIGEARMEGIIDTGAMVNIISERMWEESGLEKNDDRTMYLGDANGGSSQCVGMIEQAEIYLMSQRKLSIGDLWVAKTPSCDLLLGRLWQTDNGFGMKEMPVGTVVSFMSGNEEVFINASPNPEFVKMVLEQMPAIVPRGEGRQTRTPEGVVVFVMQAVKWEEESKTQRSAGQEGRKETYEEPPQEVSGRSGQPWTYEELLGGRNYERNNRLPRTLRWQQEQPDSYPCGPEDELEYVSTEVGSSEAKEPEPGANKWTYEADDEGGEADDEADEREENPDANRWKGKRGSVGRWYDDDRNPIRFQAKCQKYQKRRRDWSEDDDDRELDAESEFWGRGGMSRERKGKGKERVKKQRRDGPRDLKTKEIQQERFIELIMRGGNQKDWDTYRVNEEAKLKDSHPWGDWSSDDLKTEWDETSSANEAVQERPQEESNDRSSVNEGDSRRPPNNQQALYEQSEDAQEPEDGPPEYEIVRRSVRKRNMTEKAKGGEWQKMQRKFARVRETTRANPTTNDKRKVKMVNLLLVDRRESEPPKRSQNDTDSNRGSITKDRGDFGRSRVRSAPHLSEGADVRRVERNGQRILPDDGRTTRSDSKRFKVERLFMGLPIEQPDHTPQDRRTCGSLEARDKRYSGNNKEGIMKRETSQGKGIKARRETPVEMPPPVFPHQTTTHLRLPERPPVELFVLPNCGPGTYPPTSPSEPFYRLSASDPVLFFPLLKDPNPIEIADTVRRMTAIGGSAAIAKEQAENDYFSNQQAMDRLFESMFTHLQGRLREPVLNYDSDYGRNRVFINARELERILADRTAWQQALIGVNHLHEMSAHYSFHHQAIRDFLGFGATLRLRDMNGATYQLNGDMFMRFVPREPYDLTIVPTVENDVLDRGFQFVFPNSPSHAAESRAQCEVTDNTSNEQPMADVQVSSELEHAPADPGLTSLSKEEPLTPTIESSPPDLSNRHLRPPMTRFPDDPTNTTNPPLRLQIICRVKPSDMSHLNIDKRPEPMDFLPPPAPDVSSASTSATSSPEEPMPLALADDVSVTAVTGPSRAEPAQLPSPPSSDEEFTKISEDDLMNLGERSVYSTPVGIPPPDVYAGRYYDMCSELQAFVDGLPEFSQTGFVVSPATDQGSVNPQHIQPATTVQFEDDVVHVPDNAMLGDDQAAKSFRIDTPLDSELLRDPHPSPADEEMITTHLVASIDPFSQAVTLTQGIDVQDPMKPPAPCRVPTSEAVTAIANLDPPSFNLERPHPEAMANSGQVARPGTPMPGLEEVTYDTQSPPYVPQSPPEQY